MEDYVSEFESLWESFENSDDGKVHVWPKKVGKIGNMELRYMSAGAGGMTVAYLSMGDMDVDYMRRADNLLKDRFMAKEEFKRTAMTGGRRTDYGRSFSSGEKMKEESSVTVLGKDMECNFTADTNSVLFAHIKPILRGKGTGVIAAVSKDKGKVKEYLSEALKALQEQAS